MRRFVLMSAVLALAMGMALPVSAAPATTERVDDFFTLGLDADGNFKTLFCDSAHQTWKGDAVREDYSCHFEQFLDLWGTGTSDFGPAVLPDRAMKLNPDTTTLVRWWSDVSDILEVPDVDCWMYSEDFSVVITPSGNMNATVVYDPPHFEGPDC